MSDTTSLEEEILGLRETIAKYEAIQNEYGDDYCINNLVMREQIAGLTAVRDELIGENAALRAARPVQGVEIDDFMTLDTPFLFASGKRMSMLDYIEFCRVQDHESGGGLLSRIEDFIRLVKTGKITRVSTL